MIIPGTKFVRMCSGSILKFYCTKHNQFIANPMRVYDREAKCNLACPQCFEAEIVLGDMGQLVNSPREESGKLVEMLMCVRCQETFSNQAGLNDHIDAGCPMGRSFDEVFEEAKARVKELEEEVEEEDPGTIVFKCRYQDCGLDAEDNECQWCTRRMCGDHMGVGGRQGICIECLEEWNNADTSGRRLRV